MESTDYYINQNGELVSKYLPKHPMLGCNEIQFTAF